MRGRTLLAALAVAGAALTPFVAAPATAAPDGSGELHPVTPARLLDTRSGSPVGPGGTVSVQVAGRGGVPDSGVLAVALDVTATEGTAATSVTAYASGIARPRSAMLYAAAGETATAGIVVPVGSDGKVVLYNAAGSTHLLADVTGWYGTAGAPAGQRFHAFAPQPALDTRGSNTPLGAGETRTLALPPLLFSGRAQSAVVLQLAVPYPTQSTRLTVFVAGTPRPGTTTLTAPYGRISTALVVVPYGDVAVYNAAGSAHLVVHVVGWADTAANRDDGRYRPFAAATRLMDTRNGTNAPVGALDSGDALTVQVAGRSGVPYGATAVLLSVAVVRPLATGALTVYPAGSASPGESVVGYAANRPAAALFLAKLGADGRLVVRASAGQVHVALDVHGWYAGAPDYVPLPSTATPGGLVVDRDSRYAYASNPPLDRVEVVDLSTGTVLAPIAAGTTPEGLDLSPDGQTLYVANAGSNDVSVVDVATRHEVRRITVGLPPTDIAVGAHGIAIVYVRSDYGGNPLRLRLSDGLVYSRTSFGIGEYTFGEGSLAASADREYVAIGYAGSQPADLFSYDAASDRMAKPGSFLAHGTRRVAASSDGTLLVGGPYLVDRVTGDVRTLPGAPYGCGSAAFRPDDEVVYQVCGVALTATATADLGGRGSYAVAGRWDNNYDRDAAGVGVATPDGSRVVVAMNGGLALVPVGAPYGS